MKPTSRDLAPVAIKDRLPKKDYGAAELNETTKSRIRGQWRKEASQDEEQEARIEQRLRNWKRGTAVLGLGLVVGIAAVVPFLRGNPLHDQWDSLGKKILLLTMCLFVAFMYTSGITYTIWTYLRGMKQVHRKFAPPGSKFRIDR